MRVDSVDIELAAGKGTIRGVRVANPEGYSSDDAITLEAIELAIDARSVGEQPFRVTRVHVGDSEVRISSSATTAARTSSTSAPHLARIRRGAEEPARQASRSASRSASSRSRAARSSSCGPASRVRERVHLPDLELHDLGGKQGASGGEIGEQIARAFTRRVVAATASHQIGRAVEKELGEAAGDAAETILRHVLE